MNQEINLPEQNICTYSYFPFKKKLQALLVLVLISFVYYFNTLNNETVFDDGINIHQNSFVLKGIDGIPEILTNDAYASFYKRMNADAQLNGGRYRPLTSISHAIEQEFIGEYRTGFYMRVEDLNNNGKLDLDKVYYKNSNNTLEHNYEYNNFIDVNEDGVAQPNECYYCWDINKNFKNDFNEDLNSDGVYNEVDCQVYGSKIRHFNNIIIYLALIVMLFLFLSEYVFTNYPDAAFLSTLLFLIHPLNTETVAVISRRDEMMSLFFILFSLYFSFRFIKLKENKSLVFAAIGLLLALLSKEYALMLIVLIPIGIHTLLKEKINFKELILPSVLFIAAYLLLVVTKATPFFAGSIPYFIIGLIILALTGVIGCLILKNKIINKGASALIIALYGTLLFYFLMRFNAIDLKVSVPDNEVLNNAYLYATGEERFSTKIAVLLYYLKLLIFPKTLVCDYSYNVLELKHFTSWEFIFSLLLNLTLIVAGIRLIIKQHVLGFAIAFYFLFLFVVSNLFFFIGTTMNEHFVFHSTVGFSIAITWFIVKGLEKVNSSALVKKSLVGLPLLLLVIFTGKKVTDRNRDWKNDITLFLHDVKNAPNSVICLGNAGARWIDLADTKEITGVNIPGQDSTIFNDYNGNLKISDEELKAGGFKNKREAALYKGIGYLEKAVKIHPKYVNGYLNLGLAFFKLDDHLKAIYYWKMAEMLYPNNPYLLNYYAVAGNIYLTKGKNLFEDGNYYNSIKYYKMCVAINKKDADALTGIATGYFNLKEYKKAIFYSEKVLSINPENAEAKKVKSFAFEELSKE
ncbi:MAG: hypothetical protein JNM96_01595 [Bacteroidia bacterium]|nr:hypothetical protein [Bacteroidia bacterium]